MRENESNSIARDSKSKLKHNFQRLIINDIFKLIIDENIEITPTASPISLLQLSLLDITSFDAAGRVNYFFI